MLIKKSPKESASKNKNFIVTNLKIFFWSPDANFSLWSQIIDFPKVFWDFQNWTFINVQFSFLEKGFGVKNRKNARVGTFKSHNNIYFNLLKEQYNTIFCFIQQ